MLEKLLQTMIPVNLVPFFANYWPYVLAGVFLYTIIFISVDKTRESVRKEAEAEGERQRLREERDKQDVLDEPPAKMRRRRRAKKKDGHSDSDTPSDTKEDNDTKEGNDNKEDEEGHEEEEEVAHVPFAFKALPESEMVSRSRSFLSLMSSRRTLRFYSEKSFDREIMENIIRTAATAPSGAHTEPWSYVLVMDKETKSSIRQVVEEEEEINYKRRMGSKWTKDLEKFNTNWSKPYLDLAPYIVLLFKQTHSFKENGEKKNHYYNEISCAISAGLFLAGVHNAGLVTLTSTPLNCGPRLRELLRRPDNEKLLMLFPVGLPSDQATVPDLQRKALDDVLTIVD